MTELEREALLVLAPLRRALRGDNRRFASWRLRLSKGPIVDWLLENGLIEMREVRAGVYRGAALFVTEAGEAFWLRFHPRRAA